MKGWETDVGSGAPGPVREPAATRNLVELKAKISSREEVGARLRSLGAVFVTTLRQRDVYFNGVRGRLKLRLQEPGADQLVQYDRPDLASAKGSRIQVSVLPPGHGMETLLSNALGVATVVTKQRDVFDWDGTRVHVDRVDGLGEYVEFERLVGPEGATSQDREHLLGLAARLGISTDALEAGSYADLLKSRARAAP